MLPPRHQGTKETQRKTDKWTVQSTKSSSSCNLWYAASIRGRTLNILFKQVKEGHIQGVPHVITTSQTLYIHRDSNGTIGIFCRRRICSLLSLDSLHCPPGNETPQRVAEYVVTSPVVRFCYLAFLFIFPLFQSFFDKSSLPCFLISRFFSVSYSPQLSAHYLNSGHLYDE